MLQTAGLPFAARGDDAVQGHWLLARLGKKVLRPGGVELTRTLLADARVVDKDVVELAPGLGRTAVEILAANRVRTSARSRIPMPPERSRPSSPGVATFESSTLWTPVCPTPAPTWLSVKPS